MIISLVHTKGGVGKSTLAWNLAHSFRELGKKVTIIDLDFQQTLYFVNCIREDKNIDVLQPQSVQEVISIFSNNTAGDIYIIDVGGFDSDINRTAIEISNIALVPISDSMTEVLGFKTFEGILKELVLDTKINIVLNNIHPLTKNFDIIKEAIGDNWTLLNTVIRSRKIYKTAMGDGSSVFDYDKKIQAQDEIRGVRDELIKT